MQQRKHRISGLHFSIRVIEIRSGEMVGTSSSVGVRRINEVVAGLCILVSLPISSCYFDLGLPSKLGRGVIRRSQFHWKVVHPYLQILLNLPDPRMAN